MDETTFVRQELVERLDKLAVLMEEIALEALDAGVLDLATDLWVASARLLSTSDDLWQPVKDQMMPPPSAFGNDEHADGSTEG
jgi:hypothetical protein